MDRYVRIGHTLNEAEKEHVTLRRLTVQQCLKRHSIPCDVVPTIALMGSGGGERAMVGLLGSILQLGETDLLDGMMYLSGVSGSTWCMSSLYKYPNWSTKLQELERETGEIARRLSYDKVPWGAAWNKWQKYRGQWDNYSNTQWWAAYGVTTYVKEIDEHVLTEQTVRYNMDPYPIYTIIDQEIKKRKIRPLKNVWVEMTPHEAGYSLTGAFVDQKYFGSKFDNGVLMKTQPEMDMLYVQGICGSALASAASLRHEAWSTLKEVAKREFLDLVCCLACEVLKSLIELNLRATGGHDYAYLAIRMNKLLAGQVDKTGEPFFINPDNVLILDKSVQMEKLKDYTLSVCDCFSDWSEGCKVDPEMWDFMTTSIRGMFSWGDTYNFLHNMQVPDVDDKILKSEVRNYIDAGLLLNSPYFSVLRKERNVDLIISLDFSEGDAMLTIEDAHKMSKEMDIAFPQVHFPGDDRTTPKDFYVFPGDGNYPTVIHMPLFNLRNCGSAEKIAEWRKRYKTIQGSLSPEMVRDLLGKAGENVTNNKDRLLEEIRKVIRRRSSSNTM